MKNISLVNCSILLAALALFSCSPKIQPILEAQKEIRYSHAWERLANYPLRFGRNDDLHFFDEQRGFVINSQGSLFKTEDGGANWELKFKNKGSFFRCLTFADEQNGFLGTLGTGDAFLSSNDPVILYKTNDAGDTWSPVEFDGLYPGGLCGLFALNENFIVGCGRVRGPSYFIKSTDGGKTWESHDLNHLAGSLIATHFFDEQHGILIGGTTTDKVECKY